MAVEIVLVALDDRREIARLPSILHRAGARVTLLGNPRILMACSRFVNRKIPCGPEPLGLSLALKVIRHQNDSPPWVICCDDTALSALARFRGEAWLDRMFPVDHHGPMVDAIFKKSAFAAAATHVVSMAPLACCTSVDEATEVAIAMGFPVVLEPDIDREGGNRIVVNEAEGIAAAWWILADADGVVVRKVIAGQTGSTDVLFHRGRPVCWSGFYASGSRAIEPQIESLLRQVGKLTGFQGFAGIEWVRDAAGEFHLLRFNGTPTPGIQLARFNGVNFSRALWELFHGVMRIQKPWAAPRGTLVEKFSSLMRVPWDDPAMLLRWMFDLARGNGRGKATVREEQPTAVA